MVSQIVRLAPKFLGYAKRGVKVYPYAVFGTNQNVISGTIKKAMTTRNPLKREFWTGLKGGLKNSGKSLEAYRAAEVAKNGSFLKSFWKNIKGIPTTIAAGWKAGGKAATKAGKSAILGKLGGALKGIGKKMPVIGSLLIAAFELPNIIKATKNEGLAQGLCEAGKAGAKLGGATLLGAVGTAIGGPLGGIVGFMVGDWLTGKLVGKSYSERKALQDQKEQQLVQNASGMSFTGAGLEGDLASLTGVGAPQSVSPEQMNNFSKLYSNNRWNDDYMFNTYGLNYKA